METSFFRFTARLAWALLIASLPVRAAHADPAPDPRPPIGAHAYAHLFEPAPAAWPTAVIRERSLQDQKPPERRRTGFQALMRSTLSDFKAFPMRKSTWIIVGIGGAAAALAHPFDDEIAAELPQHDNLRTVFKPGRYLGYTWVQAGGAIGTYVVGRYFYHPTEGRTNKISHLGFDLLRANLLTQALTFGTKYAVRRERPNGTCCAFPSGHASVTFATASVLERHFGYRSAWPTFVIASYVAASRLTDRQHFASDVLFGAALGIASGWTVVGRHGRDDFALYPVPLRGGAGVGMTWSPRPPSHATE